MKWRQEIKMKDRGLVPTNKIEKTEHNSDDPMGATSDSPVINVEWQTSNYWTGRKDAKFRKAKEAPTFHKLHWVKSKGGVGKTRSWRIRLMSLPIRSITNNCQARHIYIQFWETETDRWYSVPPQPQPTQKILSLKSIVQQNSKFMIPPNSMRDTPPRWCVTWQLGYHGPFQSRCRAVAPSAASSNRAHAEAFMRRQFIQLS